MEYEAGDVICYRPFGGGLRRVLVEQRLADVKHGEPGFDGTVVSGPERGAPVWGYDHQIVPLRLTPDESGAGGRAVPPVATLPREASATAGSTPSGRRAGRMSQWA